MARSLTGNVLVRDPRSGATTLLVEGSELPGWAEGLVGEHVLRGEKLSQPSSGSRSQAASAAAGVARDAMSTTAAATQVVATGAPSDPPPQSGAGSGRSAWARYATANGVGVSADDTRDEIISACVTAGIRTT